MIIFCPLMSGSSGNAVYIESKRTRILVDAGASGSKIQKNLATIGARAEELDAILITHDHNDHIHGAGILSRRFDLPIFATEKTWSAMEAALGKIAPGNRRIIPKDQVFGLRDLEVETVGISHDAADAVGFLFYAEGRKISTMTDLGHAPKRIIEKLQGSDILYLEANYHAHLLETGRYSPSCKARIRSARGHLSNEQCGLVLGEVLRGVGEEVFLAHLSEENNHPRVAYEDVRGYLESLGLDVERDIRLDVAGRHLPSRRVVLE